MNRARWAVLGLLLLAGCKGFEVQRMTEVVESWREEPMKKGQKVLLEVDRMTGTPPLHTEIVRGGKKVTLGGVFGEDVLRFRIVQDQPDIPRVDSLRLVDLHSLMMTHRSVPTEKGEWRLYLLVASRLAADDPEAPSTLGVMFDFGDNDKNDLPREACAIFADAVEKSTGKPDQPAEMLLTAAHEIAHCLNLHHPDWEGSSFWSDSTIEGYSDFTTVRWSISRRSRRHLLDHSHKMVRPGREGFPFGWVTLKHSRDHQDFPKKEGFTIVGRKAMEKPDRAAAIAEADVTDPSGSLQAPHPSGPSASGLRLHLHAHRESFVVGEAITLVVEMKNEGARPVPVRPLLHPHYGFLDIHIRKGAAGSFRPFRPAVLTAGRGVPTRDLAPGESILEEVKVFFGAEGWTFEEAGTCTIQASYPVQTGGRTERIASGPVEITITDPETDPDRKALQILRDERRGALSREAGLYLLLDGGDHLADGAARIARVAREASGARQAPGAKIALAMSALHPTVRSGRPRAPARLDEAKGHLEGILDTDHAPRSIVLAQSALVKELKRQGRDAEADGIQQKTIQKMKDRPGAKDAGRAFGRR